MRLQDVMHVSLPWINGVNFDKYVWSAYVIKLDTSLKFLGYGKSPIKTRISLMHFVKQVTGNIEGE